MVQRRESRRAYAAAGQKFEALVKAGYVAYQTPGVPRAPGIDPAVREVLRGERVGSLVTRRAFELWLQGWNKAADEAAAQALNPEGT